MQHKLTKRTLKKRVAKALEGYERDNQGLSPTEAWEASPLKALVMSYEKRQGNQGEEI